MTPSFRRRPSNNPLKLAAAGAAVRMTVLERGSITRGRSLAAIRWTA